MFELDKIVVPVAFILSLSVCVSRVESQTYCTLKFAAFDTSVCDATGTLEENINAEVYQTKGNIEVMDEYEHETFKIFDQQINDVLAQTQSTTGDVTGLEEEVTALKRQLTNIQNGQTMTTSGVPIRSKRASGSISGSPSSAQQALDAAKLTFQQNVSDTLLQLQNISQILDKEAKASAAQHTTMLQEVSKNQQDLTAVEQQIQTLDNSIRQLSAPNTTGSGVNLTSITQEVTQLVIDASVAEKIAQRQYDYDEQLLKQVESDEQSVDSDIQAVNATLSQADKDLNNDTSQINTLIGAEQFYETRVGNFFNSTTDDINNLTKALGNIDTVMLNVGNNVLSTTVAQNTLTNDLKASQQKVDGIQSLVTFTKKAQQKQLGDLLSIKRDVIDDLNVLKYAFGLLTQVP